jgi:hypothetical protein
MKKALHNIISIAGGTFLGCLGSYTYLQVSSQSQSISPMSVTKSHVSSLGTVAKVYSSTDELLDGSDLVVRGRFTGKPDLSPRRKGVDLPTSASEDQQPPVRDENLIYERDPGHRNLSFIAQEVLKGEKTQKQLVVAQRGAIDSNSTSDLVIPMNGDSFFEPGTEYFLFLVKPLPHEIKLAGKDFYWITGASQGAYRVKNGKVFSRSVELRETKLKNKLSGSEPETEIGPTIDGESEDLLLSKIRNKFK